MEKKPSPETALELIERERTQHKEELLRLRAEMDELLHEQRTHNLRFNTAINNISQGLCFFDGAQRLIVCNELYARMYNLTVDLVRPGTTLREIVDHRYAAGCFPDMPREEYMRWRDKIAVSPTASDTVVNLKDGRNIAIHHQPMPDGGWVATHEDITAASRAQEALRQAKEQLEQLALCDPLTGLANRRKFFEQFQHEAARAERNRTDLSVLMFDIDHFKSINDRFGHPAGDEILKLFAVVVSSSLRLSDLSGRIGGEEFAALLPCSLEEGVLVAERIRRVFQSSDIVCEEGPVDTTVSIGVAGGPAGTELEVLLAAADTALYQAKRTGRNKVEAAEELPLSLENWRRKSAGIAEPQRAKPAKAAIA